MSWIVLGLYFKLELEFLKEVFNFKNGNLLKRNIKGLYFIIV